MMYQILASDQMMLDYDDLLAEFGGEILHFREPSASSLPQYTPAMLAVAEALYAQGYKWGAGWGLCRYADL